MEDTYFLHELIKIAEHYQFVKVDGKRPLTQEEVESLAKGADAITPDSNMFYMEHSSADEANKKFFNFAKDAIAGKFHWLREQGNLQIIRTQCDWSECYGFCGRAVCLEDRREFDGGN